MQKTFTNYEIKQTLDALNSENILKAVPKTEGHEEFLWNLRINKDHLTKRWSIVQEALDEIQQEFSKDEYSTVTSDGSRKIKTEYQSSYTQKVNTLLIQTNELDIVLQPHKHAKGLLFTLENMEHLMFMIEE